MGGLAPAALEGDHLVHGDLRPDNLLVETSAAGRVDALLAILVGYFVSAAAQDDGSVETATLRAHQRTMAVVLIDLLAARRAWE